MPLLTYRFHFPVVVEKPFTRSSGEADKLLVLAKEKERILTVCQSMLAAHLVRFPINGLKTGVGTVISEHSNILSPKMLLVQSQRRKYTTILRIRPGSSTSQPRTTLQVLVSCLAWVSAHGAVSRLRDCSLTVAKDRTR